jgi:hypothetical protein
VREFEEDWGNEGGGNWGGTPKAMTPARSELRQGARVIERIR